MPGKQPAVELPDGIGTHSLAQGGFPVSLDFCFQDLPADMHIRQPLDRFGVIRVQHVDGGQGLEFAWSGRQKLDRLIDVLLNTASCKLCLSDMGQQGCQGQDQWFAHGRECKFSFSGHVVDDQKQSKFPHR